MSEHTILILFFFFSVSKTLSLSLCLFAVAIELIVEHITELLSNTAAFLNQKRLLNSLAPVSDCVFWDTAPHRKKLQRLH